MKHFTDISIKILEIRAIVRTLIEAERDRLILFAPFLLALGIGTYFALPFEPPTVVSALTCTLLALLILAVPGPWRPGLLCLSLLVFGFGLAQLRTHLMNGAPIAEEDLHVTMTARITAIEPRLSGHSRITFDDIVFEASSLTEPPAKVRLNVRTAHEGVKAGDRVRLGAVLNPPPEPVAPGAFDFARSAYFEEIGAVGYAYTDITIIRVAETARLQHLISDFRLRIANRIAERLDGPSEGLAIALLTGLRGRINEETTEEVRIAGLSHLLAISGLHMGLVTATAFFAVRTGLALVPAISLRFNTKRAAAIIAWIVAIAYFQLAGATVPTLRAFLMTTIVLLAIWTGRQAISHRLVALAACCILILTPEALLSVGFQMSFAAVFALITAYQSLAPYLSRWSEDASVTRRIALYLLGIALSTLIAEVAIAPFAIFHFNQATSYGLLANLVAVPLMAAVIMPAGLVALFLMPFGLDAPALYLMDQGIRIVLETAHQVAALPGAEFILRSFPTGALICFVIAGFFVLAWRCVSLKLTSIPVFLLGIVYVLESPPPDILISRDADLVALNMPDGLAVSDMRQAGYSRDLWMRMAGHDEAYQWDLPEHMAATATSCDLLGCIARLTTGSGRRYILSVPIDPGSLLEDCGKAQIIIAAFPLRQTCRQPRYVLDRFDMWRDGAHAIWLAEDGPRIRSVAQIRGARPWVRRKSQFSQ